jgi:hypothetical protein
VALQGREREVLKTSAQQDYPTRYQRYISLYYRNLARTRDADK